MPRLIDQAKAAKKKADAANATAASKARAQEVHRKAEVKMVAEARAKEDFPKWKRRVLAAAKAGEESRCLSPFDDIYGDHKAITHHWGGYGEWGKTMSDRFHQFSEMQQQYVYALGDLFYREGLKIAYNIGGEEVMDYGWVEHCDVRVSGW